MNENRPKDQAEFPVIGMPSEWGLTKREYFAAMALQGLLSNDGYVNRVESYSKEIARDAVVYADALIEELEK